MAESLKRIVTLTGRNIKEMLRDPLSLVFTVALPLAMEVLFYAIFHGLTEQFEMIYLAPGIVVFSQSFLTLFTSILISTDRSSKFLTRLFVSKAKPHEFILSYALAVLPIALLTAILFFFVGGIIDTSVFKVNAIWCVLTAIVPAAFFVGLGILFGSVANEKTVGGLCSIAIMGQSVLSGMWFPVEGLGDTMTTIMKVLPFKNATDLIKNVLSGITDLYADFLIPLAIVAAYALVTITVAIIVFKHKMKED